jgi:hypothetical protein
VQANERPFCFPASVAPSEVVSIWWMRRQANTPNKRYTTAA